jgi:hypothetical protein
MRLIRFLAAMLALASTAALAQSNPLLVFKSVDDGTIGTLRFAINYANSPSGCPTISGPPPPVPTITFAADANGAALAAPLVIKPSTPLPPLTCNSMTIDGGDTGNTATGGSTNAGIKVAIDGSTCVNGPVTTTCAGLEVQASNVVIKGLAIYSFSSDGVLVSTGSAVLRGNFLGTDTSGTNNAVSNAGYGLDVVGGGAYAGGSVTNPADRNLISGNSRGGVHVGINASSLTLVDNLIGGGGDGSNSIINGNGGVIIDGVSPSGPTPPINARISDNFIRFNTGPGISTTRNNVQITENIISGNGDDAVILYDEPVLPPVITSFTFDGTNTTVTATTTLDGTLGARVDIFSNPSYSLTNFPSVIEGQSYLTPISSNFVANASQRVWTIVVPGQLNFPTATFTAFCDCTTSPTSQYSSPVIPPLADIAATSTISVNGIGEIVVVFVNANDQTMNNVSFTYTLPSDISLAGAISYTGDCGTSAITQTAAGFSVSNLTLPGNIEGEAGECDVTIPVTSSTPGSHPTGGSSPITSDLGTGGTLGTGVLLVTAPSVLPSPSSFDFGSVAVGSVPTTTFTFLSSGTEPLVVSAISAITSSGGSNAFAITGNSCFGEGLSPGSTCTVTVSFSPTLMTAYTGELQFVSNAGTLDLALTGTGVAPFLQVSPMSVNFGGVFVGASATSDVTLTNTGTATLTFASIIVTNDAATVFTQAPTTLSCGTTLAVGASCIVRVKFAPAALSTYTGMLQVTGNFAAGSANVSLTGNGTAPPPTVSPPSVSFGNVPVGGSASSTVTITNGAAVDIPIAVSLAASAFTVTSTCGATLAAGASCAAAVTFAPTSATTFSGTMQVVSSLATPSTVNVPVSGTGVTGSLPVATFSASSVTFARQTVGTTSPAQTVTLTNTGSTALHITSIAISGDFGYTGCGFPQTLAPGTSCSFMITFSPLDNGTRTGAIAITDDAGGSPQAIALTGIGANGPQAAISLQPFGLDFGDVRIGVQHSDTITIASVGSAPLAISSISINGPGFTQTNNCPASVPVGGSCVVTVYFQPTSLGAYSATLTVASNGDPASFNASLAGNGVPIPPAVLTVDRFVDFGQVVIGSTGRSPLDLRNTGEQPLSVTGLALSGAGFALDGSCDTIAPSGVCTVTLVFTPSAVNTFTGGLTISSNDARGAIRVDLLGQGVALPKPEIELSVSGIGFANQFASTTGHQTVTIRSVGTAPLHIHGIGTAPPFGASGCPATLAIGATCDVDVTFTPPVPGTFVGSLAVDSDDPAGRASVSLTGTGCSFFSLVGRRSLVSPCR